MRSLLLTSTDLMMIQFLVPHVKHLANLGYEIDLACSDVGGRIEEVREALSVYTNNIFELHLQRSPLSPTNLKGYREAKKIFKDRKYDIIWTNEPVMGVVTRLAARKARKRGTKVLYMAHGFHFFNGAPKLNWLIFYPIEKIMAKHADLITCVNYEDRERAKKFFAKNDRDSRVKYIHGIGINTTRLTLSEGNRNSIRQELGLSNDSFIILSIGELNQNKNHKTILKALAEISIKDIHYIICGKGEEEENLRCIANELGITAQVHFLGYRRDVVNICAEADVYAMPSHREGLPVSSLEAMYCGLPLVTSNIRGLVDVNKSQRNGILCDPDDYKGFATAIKSLYFDPTLRASMGENNKKDVKPYEIRNTLIEVETILKNL